MQTATQWLLSLKLLTNHRRLHDLLGSLLVFVIMLAAYWRTLLSGPVGGDAGELQYAGPLLALVHPTGQPLYILLGWLWSHLLPGNSMAWRMNMLAAISAVIACAFITWTFLHLRFHLLPALVSGVVFGAGATLWSQAVLADKYAFTALLTAIITGLALIWVNERGNQKADHWLYALASAVGLSLLHHRSLFLLLPGFGLLVLYLEREMLWRYWQRSLVCLLLVLLPGLVVYPLFLPLVQSRHLSPILWQPTSITDWPNWWLEWHVLKGEAIVFDSWARIGDQVVQYIHTLLADYSPIMLVMTAIGVVRLSLRNSRTLLYLVPSFVLTSFLAANFRGNERQFTYYLPSFVILAYLATFGLEMVWVLVTKLLSLKLPSIAAIILASLLILIWPTQLFRQVYPRMRITSIYGEPLDIWRQTLKSGNQGERLAAGLDNLPYGTVVLADWEQLTILWYYQKVMGRRPDLTLVYPIQQIDAYISSGRDIALARSIPIDNIWHPTSAGSLVLLQRQPTTALPAEMTPLGIALIADDGQERIELAGYLAPEGPYLQASYVPLDLVWLSKDSNLEDYSISLRILNSSQQVV